MGPLLQRKPTALDMVLSRVKSGRESISKFFDAPTCFLIVTCFEISLFPHILPENISSRLMAGLLVLMVTLKSASLIGGQDLTATLKNSVTRWFEMFLRAKIQCDQIS